MKILTKFHLSGNNGILPLRLTVGVMYIFISCHLLAMPPVTTPANFGDEDTLSKYSRIQAIRDKFHENKNKQDKPQVSYIEDERVIFSTYFAGNGYNCSWGLAADSKGYAYMAGYTGSTDMPTTENAYQKVKNNGHDAFISKWTPEGQPVWITYFGGKGTDVAMECIRDADDNVIIVGKTDSPDFPGTSDTLKNSADCFIIKMDRDGSLLWSRLYGGTGFDACEDVALAPNGDIVITGYTNSKDLPVAKGVFLEKNPGNVDAFAARFTPDGELVWGTYVGGSHNEQAHSLAIDSNGDIILAGETYSQPYEKGSAFPVSEGAFQKDTMGREDCFVFKLSDDGKKMIWSTLLCGFDRDWAYDLIVDSKGNVTVGGPTYSKNFPVTSGIYEKDNSVEPWIPKTMAYLSQFDENGKRNWTIYYGGGEGDGVFTLAKNPDDDDFWVGNFTMSDSLQVSDDALFKNKKGGKGTSPDIVLLKYSSKRYLVWSSYFSGGGLDFIYKISPIGKDQFYFTGENESIAFPVTKKAFQIYLSDGDYASYLVHLKMKLKNDTTDDTISEFIIFPNPSGDFLSIRTKEDCKSEIKFYNLLGITVKKLEISISQFVPCQIDISTLPIGVYFISMSNDKFKQTIPFIKL